MIKNIIFDFGRVLVDYDYQPLMESILEDPAERMEFYKVFCSMEFRTICDRGDVPFHELILEYRRRLPKWDRQIKEFCDRHFEAMKGEVPGMRALLLRLREKGYKLYGLTNWGETVYPVIEKFDILQMLDGRLISSEEHLIKPDIEIYKRLCEKFGLRMDECLFTDDKQVNVDGALAAGMNAVVFKDAAQLERELVSRIIL